MASSAPTARARPRRCGCSLGSSSLTQASSRSSGDRSTGAIRRLLYDVGALVESPAFYPFLSAKQNLMAFAATGKAPPNGRIDQLLELVGLTDRASDRGRGLLARHEAAPSYRHRTPQRPAAAAPRRACERARPGRDHGRARRCATWCPWARRSSCPATSSARSDSWPTSWASSLRADSSARARRRALAGQSRIRLHVAPEQTGPALRALRAAKSR